MASEVLVIFTRKSASEILGTGGTQGWVLDRDRAKECEYAVLCRNSRKGNEREPHGSAFMVGRISGVVPATGRDARWLVTFDRYSSVSVPGVWKHWRNPVRYEERMPLDIEELHFEPMPEPINELSSDSVPPRA